MENFKDFILNKAQLRLLDFKQIKTLIKVQKITKGAVLLHPNEVCQYSFFVESGLLRSYTIDNQGKEHVIQFAPESWIISDRSSAFFNTPTTYYIDAIEDTECIIMDKQFSEKVCQITPAFNKYNEKILHRYIHNLQKRINLLIGASAETRYADFITSYPNLLLRVPQWMIASYLGVTPESLSRVRKELAKRNFKPKFD